MNVPQPLHEQYLDPPSYTFLRTIGEGTNGPCRLHRHEVLGIWVVSKTVSLLPVTGGIAAGEPLVLDRFRHERIVRLREAQWTPGKSKALKVATFTTDYCEGRSVDTALEEGHRFSTSEALQIIADVLAALAHLHETHRVVHRDVKPGNVMLDGPRQRGFLGDLGSAALLDDHSHAIANAGTLIYLPPEANTGVIDQRADLYALGVVLLEMVNGPFSYDALDFGKMEERVDEGKRALADRYYSPSPWVPLPVAGLIRRLCAKCPDDRPSSAAEALRLVSAAACVDWRRVAGDDGSLVGRWSGTWPPTVQVARRRALQARVEPITTGTHKGMLRLSAKSMRPRGTWRSYARLARRVAADDVAGVARFFRAVEREAQAVATR